MTGRCELCERIIDSAFVPVNPDDPTNPLREYDALAAEMVRHIANRHPFQLDEMVRVQMHAGKMYAMNWAKFDVLQQQRMEELRKNWRAQLLLIMATTTKLQAPAGGAAGAPSTAGS